jgi:hypothetical protein
VTCNERYKVDSPIPLLRDISAMFHPLRYSPEYSSVEPAETVENELELFALDGFAPVAFACLFFLFMVVCFIQFLKFSACRFEVHSLHKVPERGSPYIAYRYTGDRRGEQGRPDPPSIVWQREGVLNNSVLGTSFQSSVCLDFIYLPSIVSALLL